VRFVIRQSDSCRRLSCALLTDRSTCFIVSDTPPITVTTDSNPPSARQTAPRTYLSNSGNQARFPASQRPQANLQVPANLVSHSSSAPSSGRSKLHVSFKSNLLQRNAAGGSQPQLMNPSIHSITEFPTPPSSPGASRKFLNHPLG